MIVPVSNKASDVNVALVRIAALNNKDIDAMVLKQSDLSSQIADIRETFDKQTKRWRNYKDAFNAIIIQFETAMGVANEDDLAQLLPGYGEV